MSANILRFKIRVHSSFLKIHFFCINAKAFFAGG